MRPKWVTKGKLCGFSHNSRAYRIYSASKGTIVENRNVAFLQTPPYVLRPPDKQIDYTGQDVYIDDVIDDTSFLDPFISGKTGDTPDPANAHLREQIQEMLRDNAATSRPPGDNRTMATGTALPGVVPTSSPGNTSVSTRTARSSRLQA